MTHLRRARYSAGVALAAVIATLSLPHGVAAAQTSPSGEAAEAAEATTGGDIIVTGTRASGITAAESAALVKLINAEMMEHVGQPQLNQILTQLVPSFTAEAFGTDTAALTGLNIFTNGATTRTRGIDVVASYVTRLEDAGTINWTLSGNYTRTRVREIVGTPAPIAASGQALFDQGAITALERINPRYKVIAGANWSLRDVQLVARGTLFGPTSADLTDGTEYVRNTIKTAVIADLEAGYNVTPHLTLSVGANNLFDKRPPTIRLNSSGTPSDARVVYPTPLLYSAYGINGGYYYGRLDAKF